MRLIDGDALVAKMNLAIAVLKRTMKNFDIDDDPECQMELKAYQDIRDGIKEEPTIEPERKTGKWEQESESLWEDRWSRWKCSACDKHVRISLYDDPKEAGLMFCPNCGAKMEET